jgi:hypothetical protein
VGAAGQGNCRSRFTHDRPPADGAHRRCVNSGSGCEFRCWNSHPDPEFSRLSGRAG